MLSHVLVAFAIFVASILTNVFIIDMPPHQFYPHAVWAISFGFFVFKVAPSASTRFSPGGTFDNEMSMLVAILTTVVNMNFGYGALDGFLTIVIVWCVVWVVWALCAHQAYGASKMVHSFSTLHGTKNQPTTGLLCLLCLKIMSCYIQQICHKYETTWEVTKSKMSSSVVSNLDSLEATLEKLGNEVEQHAKSARYDHNSARQNILTTTNQAHQEGLVKLRGFLNRFHRIPLSQLIVPASSSLLASRWFSLCNRVPSASDELAHFIKYAHQISEAESALKYLSNDIATFSYGLEKIATEFYSFIAKSPAMVVNPRLLLLEAQGCVVERTRPVLKRQPIGRSPLSLVPVISSKRMQLPATGHLGRRADQCRPFLTTSPLANSLLRLDKKITSLPATTHHLSTGPRVHSAADKSAFAQKKRQSTIASCKQAQLQQNELDSHRQPQRTELACNRKHGALSTGKQRVKSHISGQDAVPCLAGAKAKPKPEVQMKSQQKTVSSKPQEKIGYQRRIQSPVLENEEIYRPESVVASQLKKPMGTTAAVSVVKEVTTTHQPLTLKVAPAVSVLEMPQHIHSLKDDTANSLSECNRTALFTCDSAEPTTDEAAKCLPSKASTCLDNASSAVNSKIHLTSQEFENAQELHHEKGTTSTSQVPMFSTGPVSQGHQQIQAQTQPSMLEIAPMESVFDRSQRSGGAENGLNTLVETSSTAPLLVPESTEMSWTETCKVSEITEEDVPAQAHNSSGMADIEMTEVQQPEVRQVQSCEMTSEASPELLLFIPKNKPAAEPGNQLQPSMFNFGPTTQFFNVPKNIETTGNHVNSLTPAMPLFSASKSVESAGSFAKTCTPTTFFSAPNNVGGASNNISSFFSTTPLFDVPKSIEGAGGHASTFAPIMPSFNGPKSAEGTQNFVFNFTPTTTLSNIPKTFESTGGPDNSLASTAFLGASNNMIRATNNFNSSAATMPLFNVPKSFESAGGHVNIFTPITSSVNTSKSAASTANITTSFSAMPTRIKSNDSHINIAPPTSTFSDASNDDESASKHINSSTPTTTFFNASQNNESTCNSLDSFVSTLPLSNVRNVESTNKHVNSFVATSPSALPETATVSDGMACGEATTSLSQGFSAGVEESSSLADAAMESELLQLKTRDWQRNVTKNEVADQAPQTTDEHAVSGGQQATPRPCTPETASIEEGFTRSVSTGTIEDRVKSLAFYFPEQPVHLTWPESDAVAEN